MSEVLHAVVNVAAWVAMLFGIAILSLFLAILMQVFS